MFTQVSVHVRSSSTSRKLRKTNRTLKIRRHQRHQRLVARNEREEGAGAVQHADRQAAGGAAAAGGARGAGARAPAARERRLVPGARRQVRQERDRHAPHAAVPVPALRVHGARRALLRRVRAHRARAQDA